LIGVLACLAPPSIASGGYTGGSEAEDSDLPDEEATALFEQVQVAVHQALFVDEATPADDIDDEDVTAIWQASGMPVVGQSVLLTGVHSTGATLNPSVVEAFDTSGAFAGEDLPDNAYRVRRVLVAFGLLAHDDLPLDRTVHARFAFLEYYQPSTGSVVVEAVAVGVGADFVALRGHPQIVAITECEAICFDAYDTVVAALRETREGCIAVAAVALALQKTLCTVSLGLAPPPVSVGVLLKCKAKAIGRFAYRVAKCEAAYRGGNELAEWWLGQCLAACDAVPQAVGADEAIPVAPGGVVGETISP
jgi:hypothetical protein